ncbi:MAG: type I DNA topoisomerase [Dehalococcoidia bacterium]|nr:MAG: type I DNA topoisomerase [Dehalococcoidia bacterium]
MAKELVIVESPAKARTLSRILGSRYSVKASLGHVRDLPRKRLGVDVKNGFVPYYAVPKEKRAIVKEIKEAAGKALAVYLATDPDREGEAISWHLIEAAGLKKVPRHRVVFHEITEKAIKEAFRHPRQIDMRLVDAQQARRILDRLVGYKISPLLWRKVKGGLSAGRVQSVALRMIVEREREIQNFVPQEYWTIEVELAKMDKRAARFKARLLGIKDKGEKLEIHCQEKAEPIANQLKVATYLVSQVSKKRLSRQPAPPFITSTLQQEAWHKLKFAARHTMSIAQQLYEGLPIGDEGVVGLITYMRTDSTRVAESALKEARHYISEKYGVEFLPSRPRLFTKKAKGAQEAHEAIRPTGVEREPSLIKPYLTPDQAKLYELIWKRMVASQMAAALFDTTAVDIEAKEPQEGKIYILKATGSVLYFSGFLTLYSEGKDEAEDEEKAKAPLPPLAEGAELRLIDLFPQQHFTQPPPCYNEATLVKALEERGIGRPSTYAPIISTLRQRGYVERKDGRFHPLSLGFVVNDLLVEHFPQIVDIGFTAQMEEQLDEIARGERSWVGTIQEFYTPFEEMLSKASTHMVKVKEADQPTDELCPQCGRAMVIRMGRYGKFLACSGYPRCKTTKPLRVKE